MTNSCAAADNSQNSDNTIELINRLGILSTRSFSGLKLYGIIDEMMQALNCFPGYKGYALYLLNNETFDFELKMEKVDQGLDKISKYFQKMVEDGTIGQSVQMAQLGHYSEEDSKSHYYCYPLIGTSGIVGVVVVLSLYKPDCIEMNFIDVLRIFTRMCATQIENYRLQLIHKKSHEMVEQLVAKRTLQLVEGQKRLGDKIEDLRSNLLMSIPHEFRTPINQILGFANYLISYFKEFELEGNEDINEILSDIKDSAERLKTIFENYIYLANLTLMSASIDEITRLQNSVTFYPESVIFEHSMFRASHHERMDDIKLNLVNSPVAINEEYLMKLTVEIVDNAFKYSHKGQPVDISSHLEKDRYVICFHDHGIGFPQNEFQHIGAYMQFDRLSNEQQGMGLGLSIVSKIIDIHRGDITMESEENKYTKIYVKLPLSDQEAEDLGLDDD